jgi:glycine/D-amino acid oxidase-like deaminating enzyme
LIAPALLPSFSDKWLQVTLSTFVYQRPKPQPFSLALFHGGADFAIEDGDHLRLGSFRNLYLDKAVGVLDAPDPMTLQGVSRFFGELGWISPGAVPSVQLSVETLTCDGIPLAGALPDYPGVYLVTGFAGRGANFLFAVASQLASGILGRSGFEGLGLFSTKRFV